MPPHLRSGRRRFLGLAIGMTASGCASSGRGDDAGTGAGAVGPAECLMRGHGVVSRVLLVYEECRARLYGNGAIPPGILFDAASLVQRFVHESHEVLEESEVFPRLEQTRKFADLTRVLRAQHAAGRAVTARILELAAGGSSSPDQRRTEISSRLTQFVRMYRPHESREDTVLFPAFHAMHTPKEWGRLGERFEGLEKDVLGDQGFEHAVERVAKLERELGIEDLAQFIPRD